MLNNAILLLGVFVTAADDAPEPIPAPAPAPASVPRSTFAESHIEEPTPIETAGPFEYSHPCCGYSCSVCQWLFSNCSMPQHMPYYPELHGLYYFRPYHVYDVRFQQHLVQQWGGDPRNPYANKDIFSQVYARLAEESDKKTDPFSNGEQRSPTDSPPPPIPMDIPTVPLPPAPMEEDNGGQGAQLEGQRDIVQPARQIVSG